MGFVVCVSLTVAMFLVLSTGAATVPKANSPAVITSLGQSPDAYTVSVLAKRANLTMDYNSLLPAKEVSKYKTVIMCVGVSLKGFGSAGINLDTELKRGKELIKAAKDNKVFLVMVHAGGEGRREQMTDMLLDTLANNANLWVVLEAGNEDGYFTKLSNKSKIPVLIVKDFVEIQGVLKEMFSAK